MKRIVLSLLLAAAVCLPSVAQDKSAKDAYCDFAFRFFQQYEAAHPRENFVISPLSLQYALSMLQNGAAGNTYEELSTALGVKDFNLEELNAFNHQLMQQMPDTSIPEWMRSIEESEGNKVELPQLEICNGLWTLPGYPVVEGFYRTLLDQYDAEPRQADFATAEGMASIDRWIEEKTHGTIKEAHLEPSDLLRMVLANALYFKARWSSPFDEYCTQNDLFENIDGTHSSIPCMNISEFAPYLRTDNYQALKKYYGYDRKFSMTFIVPDALEPYPLTAGFWREVQKNMVENNLVVNIPKFTVDSTADLNSILKGMGILDAFSMKDADFSRMCTLEKLYVSLVKQMAHFAVDEYGTEASAVTMVLMEATSIPMNTFRLRRPFYFTIEDNESGTILFAGRICRFDGKSESEKPNTQHLPSLKEDPAFKAVPLFDLQGRPLQQEPSKGIFIRNGRLVLSK